MRRQLTVLLAVIIIGLTSLSLGLLLWKSYQEHKWVRKEYVDDIFYYESSFGTIDVMALTPNDVRVASDIDYISQKAAHLPGSKLYSSNGWQVVVSPSKTGGSAVFGTHLASHSETLVAEVNRKGSEENAVNSFFQFSHRPRLTLNASTEIKAPAPKNGSLRIAGRNVELPPGWYLATYRAPMGIDQSTFCHEATKTLFMISAPYTKRDSGGRIRDPRGLYVEPPKLGEAFQWSQFGGQGLMGNVQGELIYIKCLDPKSASQGDELVKQIFNYIFKQFKAQGS